MNRSGWDGSNAIAGLAAVRAPTFLVAFFVLHATGCAPKSEPGSGWSGWEVEVLVPIASEVFIREQDVPEGAWWPTFATFSNGEVYVSDERSGRVFVFGENGRYLRSIGRGKGQGPGEFISPGTIRVGSDGSVWVLDRAQGRLVRFSPDGDHRLFVPTAADGFVVLSNETVFFPPARPNSGAASVWRDDRHIPVPVDFGGAGAEDTGYGAMDRRRAPKWLASGDTEGNIVLLDKRDGYAWTVRENDWQARELELPRAIVAEAMERAERWADLPIRGLPPGVTAMPVIEVFRDMHHVSDGRVWLSGSSALWLGAFLDFDAKSASVVVPSEAKEQAWLIRALPLDQRRLVLFYAHEARLVTLVTLGEADVPDWLRH